MKRGIVIVGLNGSGKTTLGRYLSEVLGYRHLDAEDYYFEEATVPYSNARTKETVAELMLADAAGAPGFVLTSVSGDFGPELSALCDGIVYLRAPIDVRLDRVRRRAAERFGSRVEKGGDMYEQEESFFRFVASRTSEKTDEWVAGMNCPVLDLDGRSPVEENAQRIREWLCL